VLNVVVDGIGNGAVAVNFFEGDFPFVVTFFAIHGYHWIQRCTIGEAKFGRIFNGFVELFIAIYQQLAGDGGIGGYQEEGQAICFGIPIGASTVLFAGEAFGADV